MNDAIYFTANEKIVISFFSPIGETVQCGLVSIDGLSFSLV